MYKQLLPALRITLAISVLTGLIYPALVTVICQTLFPTQANGSLITANGKILGSALIGQNFTQPGYFHPRPSAAGTDGYDPTSSGGSNFGPSNPKLIDRVKASLDAVHKENPTLTGLIPADMVTASASGLDPHISPANADLQVARVAQARSLAPDLVRQLIAAHTDPRGLGFLGDPGVNVLRLNLALDGIARR